MRKLAILVAVLSVLSWLTALASVDHTPAHFDDLQIAGDVGPE